MSTFDRTEPGTTTSNDPTLAVCVLFYERPEQTIECALSILPSGAQLYILNNGSSAAARSLLAEACAPYPNVHIFDSLVNRGVGPGRNYLIASTKEAWLLFLDNDIVMHTPDWKDRILLHIHEFPDVEVFIPKLYNQHDNALVRYNQLRLCDRKALFTQADSAETNIFPGGASFVSRRLFDRLGLYDTNILVGAEDFELCLRALLSHNPVRARLIDDILLLHHHRPPTRKSDTRSVRARYDVRTIARSYAHIRQKHGIALDDGWQPWVRRQSRAMLSERSLSTRAKRSFSRLCRQLFSPPSRSTQPTTCTLFMSDSCNLHCSGCRRALLGVPSSENMSLTVLNRVLSLYPSIASFCIAGFGEPTLCPAFSEIVDLLKCRGRYVGIITNGLQIDAFSRLATKPDYISISLYGYDNTTYASYCGRAVFDEVIRNFHFLRRRFGTVGFSYIVTRHNTDTLASVLTCLDSLDPSFLHLVNYLAYDISDPEEIEKIITIDDTDLISRIDDLCRPRSYITAKPVYIDPSRPSYKCRSYCQLLNVDGSGNIGGCQRHNPPDVQYGNIFSDADPFNSPKMLAHRAAVQNGRHAHDQCRYCFGSWA